MYFKCAVPLVLLVVATSSGRTVTNSVVNSIHHDEARGGEGGGVLGDLRYVYKVYQECSATELTSCLKLKLVAALDRVARSYSELPLFEGVSFVKDPQVETKVDAENEADIEATLPRALEEREDALDGLITNRISDFLGSHTLKIKLPSSSDLQRSLEEGRGKKKKGSYGLLLIPLILGGTLVPLALGALALLAGKALIISKLALVLAGIIGIKKLLSGNGGGHDSGHVEVVSGAHSGWGRAYAKEEAQNLAYSAYTPKSTR